MDPETTTYATEQLTETVEVSEADTDYLWFDCTGEDF
jgi:hypothetical protein